MRNGREEILDSSIAFLHLRLQILKLTLTLRELRAKLCDVAVRGAWRVFVVSLRVTVHRKLELTARDV